MADLSSASTETSQNSFRSPQEGRSSKEFVVPTARHRERDTRVVSSGSKFYYLAGSEPTVRIVAEGKTQTCDDVIGNRLGVNPLQLESIESSRFRLSGEQRSGSILVRKLKDWPIDYEPVPDDPRSKVPEIDLLGDSGSYAWRALAATNISVPHVSVPTFAGELKDIPSLVRDWGGNILRQVAKGHLSWRWAIRPLISELGKLYRFSDALGRLELDLSLLSSQKYLSKRTRLVPDYLVPGPESSRIIIDSSSTGSLIWATRTVHTLVRMWASVRWTAAPGFSVPTGPSAAAFRRSVSAGLNSQAALATLWELTPWSWFIDWFAGIGTIIAATNNAIPMRWGRICIMRTTTVQSEFAVEDGPWQSTFSLSGEMVERRVRKERWPATPILPFVPSYLPLVSSDKWSILASLLVLRTSRTARSGRRTRS